MFGIDSRLQTIIVIYIVINILVYYYKPIFCFDKDVNLKDFGVGGGNKTIMPFWLFSLSITLLIYIYICVIKDDFV